MTPPATAFWQPAPGGVVIAVWVTPKAKRAAIDGVRAAADGALALAVKVTAAPDKGAANEAVERLLADLLGVPRTAVTVASGHISRHKRIRIAGDTAALTAALARFAGG